MRPKVPYTALGRIVASKRKRLKLSLSDLNEITGVSPSTLSRLERAESDADLPTARTGTIAKLAAWAGVEVVYAESVDSVVEEPLPDLVAAHLRADRNLSPEDATVLSRMFEAAYQQMTNPDR